MMFKFKDHYSTRRKIKIFCLKRETIRCYATAGKQHVTAATVTHATIEELLETVF
jgi:hypothetical protein